MKKPELLIPAGNLEKLETAVRFGADAVYVGAGPYSLRAEPTSFSLKELKEGVDFAHKNNVKVYLAMNIFPFDDDLKEMIPYLKEAVEIGVDAVIVSDPGLIELIKNNSINVPIHLSTQANTTNSSSVKFWQKQGLKRIVLARELDFENIKKIRQDNPDIELEMFVHGAMCISYSGRCLLSKIFNDRSANKGDCTQPCRWEYFLKEKERPDERFSIEEINGSTYVMNSKDLCLIEHIPELIESGIKSLKIEGRMKSAYYVALTTKIYKCAINQYFNDPDNYQYNPKLKEELENVTHRHYSTGLYFGEKDTEHTEKGASIHKYDFVGVVEKHDLNKNELYIKARNYFGKGDQIEILDPNNKEIIKISVTSIVKEGLQVDSAHNKNEITIETNIAKEISPFSIVRRKK